MALVLFIILTEILFQALSQNSNIDLGNPLPLSQGFQITGGAAGDSLGTVNFAGDVNHDGIDDIIIAAPAASPLSRAGAGIVYVIYGKETAMTTNIDLTNTLPLSEGFQIFGGNAGDSLGSAVSFASDFNNDGVDDIVIGASLANGVLRSGCGIVYVIYGKVGGMTSNIDLFITLSLSQGFQIIGAEAGDNLGVSANYAGDVNGDGIGDIIIGATGVSPSGLTSAGAAYVVYGVTGGMSIIDLSVDLTPTQGFKILGGVANGQLGISANGAGDMNKDGLDDVIIGASYADTSEYTAAGIVAVIYGKRTGLAANIDLSSSLPVSQGFQIFGPQPIGGLGISVNAAGDFNADGIDDILVAANGTSLGDRRQIGFVYIIYGVANGMTSDIYLSTPLSLSQGFLINGGASSWRLGYSSGYAGDVNMDGIADVIMGAYTSTNGGRLKDGSAFVIYGNASGMTANIDLKTALLQSQGFQVLGGNSLDYLGTSVSTAGDFNNDGAADIVIGATGVTTSGLTGAGAVYVIYGVPSCSVTNCTTCSGSICVKCATGYLLSVGGDECYISNTTDTLMQTLSVVQRASSQGIAIAASAVALMNSNNPLSLIFNALVGILMYMQLMSITYPPRLQYLLDQSGTPLIDIQDFTEAPEEINNNTPQFDLPDNFENNGFSSSFLINFWTSLVTLLIICMAIGVVCMAGYMTRSCKFVNSKINKLKEVLKWNYLLGTFSGCYGDIALFSSLELRTEQFTGSFSLETLSFIVCILANLALLVASVTMFTVSMKLLQQKTLKKLERLKKQLSNYQVVFDTFKSTSFSQQSFFLISCLRLYLFSSVLAYLFEYPLVQAILINAQCLLFLLYLIFKRPLNSTLDLIVAIILELILEIIHACVLGFAIINHEDSEETVKAITLGDLVIGCTFAFIGVQILYIVIQMIISLRDFIKFMMKALQHKHSTTVNKKTGIKVLRRSLNFSQVIVEDGQDTIDPSLAERGSGISPMQRAAVARRPRDQPTVSRTRSAVDPRFQALWDMIDRSREEHMNSPSPVLRQIPKASTLNKNDNSKSPKHKSMKTRTKRK